MEAEFDPVRAREAWRRRAARKAEEEQKLREAALARARTIAARLKKDYGVERVYLYGSLVWGRFDARSDIDLFAVGFPRSANYWAALAAMEHLAVPFPLQIVLAETAHPGLRQRVEKEGLLL
ncbi:MAG TPA: nucleotidyltransferase domain-containing protein [Firmicutes bacterium]|nr:nucleotidyltransferase domain-containing protein [Bacillota bacterium]